MDYVAIAERLFDKFGVPGLTVGGATWLVWQLLKPIVNNINKSTDTLVSISNLLSSHNQQALDMHDTCRTHGTYMVDVTAAQADNHTESMQVLQQIDGRLINMHTSINGKFDNLTTLINSKKVIQ